MPIKATNQDFSEINIYSWGKWCLRLKFNRTIHTAFVHNVLVKCWLKIRALPMLIITYIRIESICKCRHAKLNSRGTPQIRIDVIVDCTGKESNKPISQIPECTCSISHNAPFRTEMCTFLFWMEHYGIWNRCILGFLNWVNWDSCCDKLEVVEWA